MPQVRVEKLDCFAQICNIALQDSSLSFKARGLLAYMLSLPKDWDYSIAGLAATNKTDGICAIRSGVHELMQAGYITRQQTRNEKGGFSGYEYVVHEMPQALLENDDPSCDFAMSGNLTQQILNRTKKKDKEKKIQKKRNDEPDAQLLFDRFWKAYPKKKGKEAARKAWKKLSPDLELCRAMSAALDQQKRSAQWQEAGGQYIPYPSKWLNEHRWEDEPDPSDVSGAAPYNEEGEDGI